MTEAEWLTCEDPRPMLEAMTADSGYPDRDELPRPSDRKLRLFAVACYRAIPSSRDWTGECRDVLEASEALADEGGDGNAMLHDLATETNCWCGRRHADDAALRTVRDIGSYRKDLLGAMAALLRDIVGMPWLTVTLKRPLPWIVTNLATAAYEERLPDGTLDPVRLFVLADSLEEAGMHSCSEILEHLRLRESREHSSRCGTMFRGCAPECPKAAWERSGPHVRGCWALDLILGRE